QSVSVHSRSGCSGRPSGFFGFTSQDCVCLSNRVLDQLIRSPTPQASCDTDIEGGRQTIELSKEEIKSLQFTQQKSKEESAVMDRSPKPPHRPFLTSVS